MYTEGTVQAYDKPHLTFEQQLELLQRRGLHCDDETRALTVLRAVGYYRLSAYVYPFREPLDSSENPTSPFHFRSDRIREGTTFDHVEKLWRFDRSLRIAWFDALETIEVGVRTQVAYVLGRRDPFGHTERAALDEVACQKTVVIGNAPTEAFDVWRAKYADLCRKAAREDYMQHNLHKYGGDLPVWIAIEFLDFGAVARLYRLMRREDQNEIARGLGIKQGGRLAKLLQQLNYARNLCAHHSRVWNRNLTYAAPKDAPAALPDELVHTASVTAREKLYVALAFSAHLAHALDSGSNCPSRLRTVIRKFPDLPDISPQGQMGFPDGWADQPLWKSHERR